MIALFFDTETTGFKHGDFIPEIVQIGALLQDTDSLRVLGEVNLIVKPQNPIPEEVSMIHGITDQVAAAYGVDSRIAEKVFCDLAFMSEMVVAHNIQFDMGIIKDAWPLTYDVLNLKTPFCTMKESTTLVGISGTHAGGYKWPKLAEAYRHFFGTNFDNAHDAMADVRACRDVYFQLLSLM